MCQCNCIIWAVAHSASRCQLSVSRQVESRNCTATPSLYFFAFPLRSVMPGASANVFQEHASLAEGPERGGVNKWGEKSVFHCVSVVFSRWLVSTAPVRLHCTDALPKGHLILSRSNSEPLHGNEIMFHAF